MKKFPWKKVHFIGVNGIGNSGIALLLAQAEVAVSGSDLILDKNTLPLEQLGANLWDKHDQKHITQDIDLVIFSSAIKKDNCELIQAKKLSIRTVKRGVFLSELASYFSTLIAIAGSHGKTSVTTLLVHICQNASLPISYIIGGHPIGFEHSSFGGDILIVEADESDGTLTILNPDIGVLINSQQDHSWSVGGDKKIFANFQKFCQQSKTLVYSEQVAPKLIENHRNKHLVTFDENFPCFLIGKYNKLNAQLACKIAKLLDITSPQLDSFCGVKRRLEFHFRNKTDILIEDYAHHPTEVSEVLQAVKENFPNYSLTIIFQPHRTQRLQKYQRQFIDIFSGQEQVFITPVFTAWEEENTICLQNFVRKIGKNATLLNNNWQENAEQIIKHQKEKSLILVLGAGTIGGLIPFLKAKIIEEQLKKILPNLEIITNFSWKELSTLSIGEQTPLVCQPKSFDELQKLQKYIYQNKLASIIVGWGSNILGLDEVYAGIIIRLKGEFEQIKISDKKAAVGAGVRFPKLVKQLIKNSLGGGEALIAIPATLGGAIRMNAGANGKEICDFVKTVYGLLPDGSLWEKSAEQIKWSYRGNDIANDVIITHAELIFEYQDPKQSQQQVDFVRNFRKTTQPGGKNAGCSFINPTGDSAGRLIDKYNLKGKASKYCFISDKHANFFINDGQATAREFKRLLQQTRREIFAKTGIILNTEIKFADQKPLPPIKPMLIAVFKGGVSLEREVSLKSGEAIENALIAGGHNVVGVDITTNKLPELPNDIDLVFLALHGEFGEDGHIQKLLEKKNIAYTGSSSQTSALAIDKFKTNKLLQANDINTPHSISSTQKDISLSDEFDFPLIVKPNSQGSTFGLSLVQTKEQLPKAINKAFTTDKQIMIEQFIKGIEVTVAVLEGEALPVVEIIYPNEIFDFDAKYEYKKGTTFYNCPPTKISQEVQKQMQAIAVKVWQLLQVKDILRVDMIYDEKKDKIFVLEANTLPGFTAQSLFPKAAKKAGISFVELCNIIAQKASKRK